MSFRRRARKFLGWLMFLGLAIVLGGTFAAYFYATDSETLSDLIRREAPRFLPGCRVDVDRVRLRPFWGDVQLSQVWVRERGEGAAGPMVAHAYRVTVRFDPWALLKGRFEPRDVTVSRPRLRLRRDLDGSWNLQGLLADPWPIPRGGPIPPIAIQDGLVELVEPGGNPPLVLLRDVAVKVPASPGGAAPVAFDLSARGETGLLDRAHVEGTVDPITGRVTLKDGELVRLSLSEAYHDRLPAPARDWLAKAGLDGGEVDADLASLTFDPDASPRLRYRASAKLRRGLWKCPKLPFPISDLGANVEAVDGELTILDAHGSDGSTSLLLSGRATIDPVDPARSTFRLVARAANLELDRRLRDWIPAKEREDWDSYFPGVKATPSSSAGRINVTATATRLEPGGEVDVASDVECLDVSVKYKHFAYPVDHLKGTIRHTKAKLDLDLTSRVNDKPVRVSGTVERPGPDAVACLSFEVASLPLDEALFNALPPEVKPVVASFNPAGTVRGTARMVRRPPLKKGDDPKGRVQIDATIDLNPGCSATWDGLKYPVRDLQGRLEVHPDLWVFREIRGHNGQASIALSGQLEQLNTSKPKVGPDALKVDVKLKATNLPFDQQLRDALPAPWKVTWATLNPTGASDIDATIAVDPRKAPPARDHYNIVIVPREQTGVRLRFNPVVGEGPAVAPREIELRMDEVGGTFVFDTEQTPPTSMRAVAFKFRGAPVTFEDGRVDVRDNGQFQLGVRHLEVLDLRLDEELRRYMPPVMAQVSRKLDDLKIPKVKANLELGWSGRPGESAWCKWDRALVVLNNNKVEIGGELGLEHIQGELNGVAGSFDGREFQVRGQVDLGSVDVLGQQITRLTADVVVEQGFARLEQIRGKILGGALDGHVHASLAASPDYSIRLSVKQADLKDYAMNLPGHQGFRGLVTARVELSGLGYDPRTITGSGFARVDQGDLGTLPVALRFFNVLKPARDARKETKTAFDSAEVAFRIHEGATTLDPVRLTGNAFSLDGHGTIDVRGEIDLKLRPLPGRDSLQIPVLSDLTRGLSGQILVVRVHGPVAAPSFRPEIIPLPGEVGKAIKRHKEIKKTGLVGPLKTGLEARKHGGIASRWFGRGE